MRKHETNKRRSRPVKGSNGLIQSCLDKPIKLGAVSDMRAAFAMEYGRASENQAESGRDQMYTFSCQIRKSVPPPQAWDLVDKAYIQMHSLESGSLGNLLLSLHALGFRLFAKSSQATQFLAASGLTKAEKKLKEAIEKQSKVKLPQLTVARLYNALTSQVRGKGDETSVQPLVVRFHTDFLGAPLKADAKSPEIELFTAMAEALVKHFDTWREMLAEPVASAKVVTEVLAKKAKIEFDFVAPFQVLAEKTSYDGDLKSLTFAFDPEAPLFSTDEQPDFLLKAICARYAQEGVNSGIEGVKKITKYVKECITTTNANGMGWFYNKAPSLVPVATDEEVRSRIGIEPEHPSFIKLKSLLKEMREPALFSESVLADCRTAVQGMVDSTIANHFARSQDSMEALKLVIEDTEIFDLLSSATQAGQLENLQGYEQLSEILLERNDVLQAGVSGIEVLLGYSEKVIDFASVSEAIRSYDKAKALVDYFASAIGAINGARKTGAIDLEEIKLGAHWNALIELFRLGPAMQQVQEDRALIIAQLAQHQKDFDAMLQLMSSTYDLNFEKALANRAKHFAGQCKQTAKTALKTPELVAYRDLLSRLTNTAFRGSEALRRVALDALFKAGIVESKLELREHIFSRKHYVFVSPLDTKPKKLVRLTERQPDLLEIINEIKSAPSLNRSDRLQLDLTYTSILLTGLPDKIETRFIDTKLVRERGDYRRRYQLDRPVIDRTSAMSLISGAYRSTLSGLNYRANKTEFLVTRTFKPYTGQKIYIVPKQTNWCVPKQMFEGRFAAILSSKCCDWDEEGILNVANTAFSVAKCKDFPQDDILAFLKELPHRIYVSLGIAGWGVKEKAIKINDGKIESVSNVDGLVPIARNTDNTQLEKVLQLMYSGGAKVSPPQVQFERAYRVVGDQVEERKDKRRVILQLPSSINYAAEAGRQWEPKYILGIDPGVYGMGLSLVNYHTGEVKDSGFLHINSLIQYCKKRESHIKVTTPRQQYRAPYSDHLSKAQDAAVGDITHVIDRLIIEFSAVPVFEMPNNGKDPSDSVWQQVQALYCWGDNDAQNKAREVHWKGTTHFDTPLIRTPPAEKKGKPFTGYPGVRVGSYGNSFTCACCGRNAVEDLRQTVEKTKSIQMTDGKLNLDGGTITLMMPDPDSVVERRHRNLGPVYIYAGTRPFSKLSKSSQSFYDLTNTIKRSIRRSPESRQSKQGINSVFVCPYEDCRHTSNADANASVNVAKKFIEQLANQAETA